MKNHICKLQINMSDIFVILDMSDIFVIICDP